MKFLKIIKYLNATNLENCSKTEGEDRFLLTYTLHSATYISKCTFTILTMKKLVADFKKSLLFPHLKNFESGIFTLGLKLLLHFILTLIYVLMKFNIS